MRQSHQSSSPLMKLLGSAALVGLVSIVALGWSVFSSQSQKKDMEKQLDNQATQIAKQDVQIALNAEQNRLLALQATVAAEKSSIEEQLRTTPPTGGVGFGPTATALAIQSSQIEATRQAIEIKQRQIEATQTAVVAECLSTDYTPPLTGVHPPIGTQVCIPSGDIAWISSDPAQFSIPSINYNKTFNVGFTFMLFGPVKFKVSGVQSKSVWMDTRENTSLMGNFDGKTLNLIYQNGKVCDFALYTGTACP